LAAAGLIALNDMTGRLQEDHDNARLLAVTVSPLPQVDLDPALVQTNIVLFDLLGTGNRDTLVSALARRGVLVGTVGSRSIRLVTHHDVDRAACQQAGAILLEETADGGKSSKSRSKAAFFGSILLRCQSIRSSCPSTTRKRTLLLCTTA
jgi:threonine aldolase